jgi:tRNA-modifying protein YgfZ
MTVPPTPAVPLPLLDSAPLPVALHAAQTAAIVTDLSALGVLHIHGEDAQTFLQAQLTSDVAALAPAATQYTAWCSAKGRVLANGVLCRTGPAEYLWLLPAELAAPVHKRIQMFVLRAKVKLEDASSAFMRIGVGGPRAHEIIADRFGKTAGEHELLQSEGGSALALPGARYVLLLAPQHASQWVSAVVQDATPAPYAAWQWLTIRAGDAMVTTATQDLFVPQMLNGDALGAVSFTKGCYPGQEIVARMRYLGKLKERLFLAHLRSDRLPAAGDPLYAPAFGEQACGTIVDAAPAPEGGVDVLAVVQIDAAQDMHLGSRDGPSLDLLPLPYPVPGL